MPEAQTNQTIPPFDLKEGEHYAGILLGKDGAADQTVILLKEVKHDIKFKDAQAWAASVGGELPTPREQALLFANLPEHFDDDAYWSGEQHASDSSYAWYQGFDYGGQLYYYQSNELKARAVRRLPI